MERHRQEPEIREMSEDTLRRIVHIIGESSAADGGCKAAAERLVRDGLGILRWNKQRLFIITDAGRFAMESV